MFVILRPYLLSYKNKFTHSRSRFWGRELAVFMLSALMMTGMYSMLSSFLRAASLDRDFGAIVPEKLLSLGIFALFSLLVVSNIITALGSLYGAKDLALYLYTPVTTLRLYFARLTVICCISSWMFLLFALPAIVAYQQSLGLGWNFIFACAIITPPMLLIPPAIAVMIISAFINLFPPHRIRDLLAMGALIVVVTVVIITHNIPVHPAEQQSEMHDMALALALLRDPNRLWLPSTWAADILRAALNPGGAIPWLSVGLLESVTAGVLALGYLCFDRFLLRSYTRISHVPKHNTPAGIQFTSILGRWMIPFHTQFRALVFKEARMFARDTAQSLQLLLLLMLTFVYLYNFRALQMVSAFNPIIQEWWRAVLSITNIALGACIVAAIATRFVFPTISLEGRAFSILRCAPMTVEQLLRNKFLIWFGPIAIVSVVLIVSGAWAIEVSPQGVVLCGLIAFAISIGVVGLGVGIGAVYVKFDWDSPTEIAASFGSLVYMLLALAVLFLTLIPASFLIILNSVPSFSAQLSPTDHLISTSAAYMALFFINTTAAQRALSAGCQALKAMES